MIDKDVRGPAPEASARLDVVVALRDGLAHLPTLIAMLRAQNTQIDNVVFVDDASTDGSAEYLRAQCPVWTVATTDANRGPAAARNLGAASTDAGWLLFLDVDDRPDPTWYSAFASAAVQHARIVRRGVTIVEGEGRRESLPGPGLSGCFMVGSWAVERSLWDGVGGYDPRYRYSENTELSLRMRRTLGLVIGSASPEEIILPGCGLEVVQDEQARVRNARHALSRREAALRLLAEHRADLTSEELYNLCRVVFSTDLRTRRVDRLPVDLLRLLRHR